MKRLAGIGQYVALDSPVHSLDAAAKITVTAGLTIGVFLVQSFWGLGAFAALIAVAILVSRVPPTLALRGVRAVSFFLVFTILANGLRWMPATVALARLGPLAVDREGLVTGVFFAVRILVLVIGTSVLTLTTSPVELAAGLERVLRPLKWVRVPVEELALTLSIALRFIPTTAEEAERVVTAQRSRGASFDRGGLIARTRAYVPVLVPLFFNLFRRADELATAMEARCYRGTEGRTRLNARKMRALDWVAGLGGAAALLALGVLL